MSRANSRRRIRGDVREQLDAGSSESAPGANSGAAEAVEPRFMDDPVTRKLTIAFLGVILLFLVAVISALVFGMLTPAEAPRTITERSLAIYGAQVEAGNADTETWAAYISALIDAGQLSEARKVLNNALDSAQTDKSAILLQQARLEFAAKNYQASVDAAEEARVAAEGQQAAKLAELKAKGITEKAINALPTSWAPAVHQKADALVELGKDAEAVEAYSLYLTNSPADSTILVSRGEAELRIGDRDSAEADFRAALRYIPDYQPALDALEDMGAAAK